MQMKSILVILAMIPIFAVSCTMMDSDSASVFRSDYDDPDVPVFDCSEDPIEFTVGEPIVVWPPNHEFTEIALSDCVESISGGCFEGDVDPDAVLEILSVESDEAENYKGDGNTCGDTIMITGESMVEVLAERSGSAAGDGRVYTITFGVSDEYGGGATGTCEVHVPLGHNVPVVKSDCQVCVGNDADACQGCDALVCED